VSEAMEQKKAKVARFVDSLLERLPPSEDYSNHYLGWFECFNTQHYYEAHDVLEAIWHTGGRAHPNYAFYKGLIQLAGAFVHMQLHYKEPHHRVHGARLDPACRLFELAFTNLARYPAVHEGLDLEATVAMGRRYYEAIQASDCTRNPFLPEATPRFPFPDPETPSPPSGGELAGQPRPGGRIPPTRCRATVHWRSLESSSPGIESVCSKRVSTYHSTARSTSTAWRNSSWSPSIESTKAVSR